MLIGNRTFLLRAGMVAAAFAAAAAGIAWGSGAPWANAQTPDSGAKPYAIEYYYKTK